MDTNEAIFDRIEGLLSDNGLTVSQWLAHIGKKNSPLLNMCDTVHQEFCQLYDQIETGVDKKVKGQKLEELAKLLFENNGLFDCRKNYRTSTNEIDLLLSWSQKARSAGVSNAFPCFGEVFLCECKNYEKKISVTYVGKFYSLMSVTQIRFGVMFSWEGITGRNEWMDSRGLVKKIALRDKVHIITIDKDDLKLIYEKKQNICSLLLGKLEALDCDINFQQYISDHEAKTVFSSL